MLSRTACIVSSFAFVFGQPALQARADSTQYTYKAIPTLPGGTFVGIGSATSGSVSGSVTLNATTQISTTVNGDSLKKLLLANLTYVNIHTTSNPGGEIRAQLVHQ